MPLVSVVIPLYNKEQYIVQTIESVLNQNFTDVEILVVDNLSTDEGVQRVRALSDPRISVLTCQRKGVSATRNVGLEAASGEWIVFLDADDLLKPTYLASQLDLASRNPTASIIVCGYQEFEDGPDRLGAIKRPCFGAETLEALQDSSIVYCPGPQHMFLVRRSLIGSGIRWLEPLDRLLGEDTSFWFEALMTGTVAFNPGCEALYRVQAANSRFDELSRPRLLLDGITAAVSSNLQFLKRNGIAMRPGMAESLMRFYYGMYLYSKSLADVEAAEESLEAARHWLSMYFELGGRKTPAMWIRRLMGLRLYAACIDRTAHRRAPRPAAALSCL
jgi:glycosyltransferase involved in cell wall biosynthesis